MGAAMNAQSPRRLADMPLAAQAAMLGQGPAFWRFLNETQGYQVASAGEAAEAIREICDVSSRKQIRPGTEAEVEFRALKGRFEGWMRGGT